MSLSRPIFQHLTLILVALLCACLLASDANAKDWDELALTRVKHPPLGLPSMPFPHDNKPTKEKITLGRKLFFDRRLSINDTMSCGMCHIPEQGFASNVLATAVGVEGRTMRRNSPTIFNVAYAKTMFHDARDTSLETQIFGPLLAHAEMANPSMGMLLDKIKRLDDYTKLFNKAFGTGPDVRTLGWALATYQRTLLSANSPFDRWLFGKDKSALNAREQKGYQLFIGKAGCFACHLIDDNHALFIDDDVHNTGLGAVQNANDAKDGPPIQIELAPGIIVPVDRHIVHSVGLPPIKDFGRLEVTDNPQDLYKYKTPSLRNVALTAPYMHNGSLHTLEQVVRFYNKGGNQNPGLSPLLAPLGLVDVEIHALVAFLKSLTGDNVKTLISDARSTTIGN